MILQSWDNSIKHLFRIPHSVHVTPHVARLFPFTLSIPPGQPSKLLVQALRLTLLQSSSSFIPSFSILVSFFSKKEPSKDVIASIKISFLAISELDSKNLLCLLASSSSTLWQATTRKLKGSFGPISELGQVIVCGREHSRGKLFGKNLEGNLEGRKSDESKSLWNDQITSGEER